VKIDKNVKGVGRIKGKGEWDLRTMKQEKMFRGPEGGLICWICLVITFRAPAVFEAHLLSIRNEISTTKKNLLRS
jgi:hypothetical protein